jgi:ATP-binding protein involved in chromosome partitioning
MFLLSRGVETFRLLKVPILGMVENMSYHMCKNCGHKEHTFGEGGVGRTAAQYNIDVLGEVR